MALTFPYALSFLNDLLSPSDVLLELRANQQLSGSGDGRFWTSQLAAPLWTAKLGLRMQSRQMGRLLDAKIRALGEGKQSFLFCDPTYWPAGGVYPGAGVTISSIGALRDTVALTGLPAGYQVYPGDRFSFLYSGTRYYFGEFAEGTTAATPDADLPKPAVGAVTPAYATPLLTVSPPLPLGASTGITVEVFAPFFRAIIPPGGYKAFAPQGMSSAQASLTILQKV